jgi:hypothetical protein
MEYKPFSMTPAKNRQKQDRRQSKGFVQPRKVEDYWKFYKKGLYITRPGRGLPAWLLPLSALILILALVFWAAPAAINRIKLSRNAAAQQGEDQISLLYGKETFTIGKPVADVFDRDDLKAARLSQGLYNEPVSILSQDCAYGFVQVRFEDGLEGYMLLEDLVNSRNSIEPDLFSYKLIVAASSKRVMSHASKGTLLVEVMMGTVLYSDYRGNGISRVSLPGGGTGWISDDGVIVLGPLEQVSQPAVDAARYFCNSAMAFNQITVIENGQSIRGISLVGIARLAGFVNGLKLPRTLAGLSASGLAVALEKDEATGLVKLDQIQEGDLVVLSRAGNASMPGSLAICTGPNLILYARPGRAAISLLDISQNTDLWQRILYVRRLYPAAGA